MKHRIFWLFISVLTPFVLLTIPITAVSQANSTASLTGKITPELQAELTAHPGQSVRFIIHLAETADLSLLPANKIERRVAVVNRLQTTAAISQADLLRVLASLQQSGNVETYHSLWIINAVSAIGTAEAITAVAARPEVKNISLDAQHRYFDPPGNSLNLETFTPLAEPPTETSSWGIEQIRAFHAWHGLGVDGDGVTVAIMDSGVDWLHPILYPNYRGNLGGGVIEHEGNWFFAADPAQTTPVDYIGHGTHVAGTAVGQNGFGVAPGAKWIAVSISDEAGNIFNSSVHLGFQWLLAPDGNPELAPDVVNNSWGGPGYLTTFYTDVVTLQTAGIIQLFAAGNSGPLAGSIVSPASFTNTLSVGASDEIDQATWFSSRGPSPLTSETKPWIVAPGAHILSSIPGNDYAYSNGTSMAAPHATGAVALLLSANPTLLEDDVWEILAETAVPITATHPNLVNGWGRLDVYSAVSQEATNGSLFGTLQGAGSPLPATVITLTTPDGSLLPFYTDGNGQYQANLAPGIYNLTAAPFGYIPYTQTGLQVNANQNTHFSLNLAMLPTGNVYGTVQETGSNHPLPANITVLNTPVTLQADNNGDYSLNLPAGNYTLQISHVGHKIEYATVEINTGGNILQNFVLTPTSRILLVDSGQWYYNSYASYYAEGLIEAGYSFDQWSIRNPFVDVPTAENLATYQVVIWSNPSDSPGYLGAGSVITDYLGAGGNLLISGQNVGRYDGSGFGTQIWWQRDLQAQWLGKTADTEPITGAVGTHFANLNFALNAPGSAENQEMTDFVTTREGALTDPILYYPSGEIAGLQNGQCNPFRVVYLGFGLEGVDLSTRQQLIDRSINYFQSPRESIGLQWREDDRQDYLLPEHQLVYTLTIQNLSETMTDTFHLHLTGATWAVNVLTPTVTIGPCGYGQTILTIEAPADAVVNEYHEMQLTAVSTNAPTTTATLSFQHKTPDHILLVDDDRWYDQENKYQAALDNMGVSYDVWNTNWRSFPDNTIYGDLLNAYDIVIWYTGYDWFAPVTQQEATLLTEYLAQGGRLFLNSQDFMYYHQQTPLAKDYLGVVEFQESVTPTLVYGYQDLPFSGHLPDVSPLSYAPYQNFSDALIPAPDSQVFLWHNQGVAGVATLNEQGRSLFWGIPWETLPTEVQSATMNSAVGWLSDLGDSTFAVDQRVAAFDQPRTFTVTLKNSAIYSNQVIITNTLPKFLELDLQSITGGAWYDAGTHQLRWAGELAALGEHVIRYEATPQSGNSNNHLDNLLTIFYEHHHLRFDQEVTVWLETPDLTHSVLTADYGPPFRNTWVTYTLQLLNNGLNDAPTASAVLRLPDELSPLTHTLTTSAGTAVFSGTQHLIWEGNLSLGTAVTMTIGLTRTTLPQPDWLLATAVLYDGNTEHIIRSNQVLLLPYTYYFPFIAQNE